MSLRLTLTINSTPLDDYEIKRVTNTEVVELDPNTVSVYEVRRVERGRVGRVLALVEHRYGDGRHLLAVKALVKLADAEDML